RQEEQRRQEQQAEEARAEEQRRKERKARRAREREEAVRARDREFRRKHPELGDPNAEPTEEELDIWRRWYEHEEARQKQYRRMVRLNRQTQQR
ncbi:MAG TPA: hypothetical protein VFG50_12560, partial [Rhodothermales bacterium]|nr:hypothetical protein [Rhodothermales bacterium]